MSFQSIIFSNPQKRCISTNLHILALSKFLIKMSLLRASDLSIYLFLLLPLLLFICMHVCMYVCMYVCKPGHVYVCMYVCLILSLCLCLYLCLSIYIYIYIYCHPLIFRRLPDEFFLTNYHSNFVLNKLRKKVLCWWTGDNLTFYWMSA